MRQSKEATFVTDEKGRKKAIIVPIEEYEGLLEDLHDLAVVAERREEQAISLDEIKRRLADDAAV